MVTVIIINFWIFGKRYFLNTERVVANEIRFSYVGEVPP